MEKCVKGKTLEQGVESIILRFEDGTERVVEKGAVIQVKGEELTMNFANMSGPEAIDFFERMMLAGAEVLGI